MKPAIRKPSCVKKNNRAGLGVEALEDRLALSWAGVPPTVVTPSSPTTVALNAQRQAQGTASITSTEVDYFKFTAPVSGLYEFTATTPNSNLDTVLGVFNASGQRVGYNDDIAASNVDSKVTLNLTAGTSYFVGITNYSGSGGGSYSWKIAGPSTSSSADDAYENNDTLGQAYNLGNVTAKKTIANLKMADDADWFKFTTTKASGSAGYVSLSFAHAQGDLDLELYKASGTLFKYSDGVANTERVSLSGLAAGTYYVRVFGYRGAKNPSYTLEINPAPVAASASATLVAPMIQPAQTGAVQSATAGVDAVFANSQGKQALGVSARGADETVSAFVASSQVAAQESALMRVWETGTDGLRV